MPKSNVVIEKMDELKTESGCECGGSCSCGEKAETRIEKIENVASKESCGCGNGGCC